MTKIQPFEVTEVCIFYSKKYVLCVRSLLFTIYKSKASKKLYLGKKMVRLSIVGSYNHAMENKNVLG